MQEKPEEKSDEAPAASVDFTPATPVVAKEEEKSGFDPTQCAPPEHLRA